MPLSSDELLEFIGEIYHAGLTGQWQAVLTKLIDSTQSNKAFFFLKKLDSEQSLIMELQTTFEYSQSALLDYQSRPFEGPGYQITKYLTEGESTYVNKHIDMSLHRDSSFFLEICRPLRVFHSIVGILCRDAQYESLIVINRDEDEQPYLPQEEELFRLITPHFSRAMYIFKELRLYKNYSNISKSILDQQDKAIIVCDANGRIMLANGVAYERLDEKCPVTLADNKVVIKDINHQHRLMFFIKQCANLAYTDIGVQETIILDGGHNENILLTISPLINQNVFNDLEVPCCMVTAKFQQQQDWLKISVHFSLTPKEMRLLQALYAKQKMTKLAEIYHVSYNTLRTQLQAIFKKVAVNSQTELMIKLSQFT
jgi:DNA-binding CsgD family transcriptional regulator